MERVHMYQQFGPACADHDCNHDSCAHVHFSWYESVFPELWGNFDPLNTQLQKLNGE